MWNGMLGTARDIGRMPQKIARLTAARPDLGLGEIRRWHRLLVYKEPLVFDELFAQRFIDAGIPASAKPYHLMGIEEFEDLMTLEGQYGVVRALEERERESQPTTNLRTFVGDIGRRESLSFSCRPLAAIETEFFDSFTSRRDGP